MRDHSTFLTLHPHEHSKPRAAAIQYSEARERVFPAAKSRALACTIGVWGIQSGSPVRQTRCDSLTLSIATKRGAQERGSWPGHLPYQADSPSSSQAKLERDLNDRQTRGERRLVGGGRRTCGLRAVWGVFTVRVSGAWLAAKTTAACICTPLSSG